MKKTGKSMDVGPYVLGEKYLVRTVTMTVSGRLVGVYPQELAFEDAAWIASTGRFAAALASGVFDEVEPFPDGVVVVGRGAIVDACVLKGALPRQAQ